MIQRYLAFATPNATGAGTAPVALGVAGRYVNLNFPEIPIHGVATFILLMKDLDEEAFLSALALLSPEEHARFGRLVFARDKRLYGAARILLRLALAYYLSCLPEDIVLLRGAHGKPYIESSQMFDFSISHCEDCVVVALGRGAKVGSDVESAVIQQPDYEDVARRYYATAEFELVRKAPQTQGYVRFIELWTLKEAYLKAIGRGLSKGLNECEFAFSGDYRLHFIDRASLEGANERWHFFLYEVSSSFRFSLATNAQRPETISSYVVDLGHSMRKVDLALLRSG